jgi:flagellar biosynthesis protein FlhF
MMNVKKYRAETTREALEKIKKDLGEDAFVLETKQVRAGGFMGYGAKTQIEISATPSMESSAAKQRKSKSKNSKKKSIIDFNEDVPAFPAVIHQPKKIEKVEIMNALQSRAASVKKFDNAFPYKPKKISFLTLEKEIETVEISSESPKLVHSKKEAVNPEIKKQVAPQKVIHETAPQKVTQEIAPQVSQKSSSPIVVNRELELLRAELREVKFSINAFTAKQNIQPAPKNIEIDTCSLFFEPPFSDAYNELTAMGISPEVAHKLVAKIIPQFKKGSIKPSEITNASLRKAILSLINFGEDPLKGEESAVLAFIGATGVGKTTTIAKLAARIALEERRRVELVTLDTYRIAAVEQLKTYAEIIGVGCHVVRSVLELDVLVRRFPADATVLIDTTGRNPHDLADQHELSDYLKRHTEIRKCLAVQATTHPLDAIAAVKKFEMYGADCLALTKLDETTRPGAMLELLAESALPLVYLCAGQRVPEDIKAATPESFAARIFGEKF